MSFVKSTALNVRRPKHFFLNSIFPSLISLACPCNYDILCVLKSNFKCTKYIAKYTFCHTINKLHYCDKNYFIASLHWWIWCEVLFMELKTWIRIRKRFGTFLASQRNSYEYEILQMRLLQVFLCSSSFCYCHA